MNPYVNDVDFQARREHYHDMLRSAEANIALRRGELPGERGLRFQAAALAGRLLALLRRARPLPGAAIMAPADPCADAAPCS